MWSDLASWVLTAMVSLEPVSTPGHTPADVAAWPAMAEEIALAAQLWPLQPAATRELDPVRYTAALLVVYAWRESRFRWMPCDRRWTCDKGRSAGPWQTATSWGEPSAALTVELMHESWQRCGGKDRYRLAGYAYGADCDHRRTLVALRDAEAERLVVRLRP